MADFRRARCVVKRGGCGRHKSEVGLISWGGLCGDCAERIFVAACNEMHEHDGPTFDHWRRRMAASVGAIPLDELEALAAALPDDV